MSPRRTRSSKAPAALDDAEEAINVGLTRNAEAANYQTWLYDLASPHLGPTCLEIGSGRGDLTGHLAEGRRLVATDVSEQFVGILEDRFADSSNVTVRHLDMDTFVPDERYDSIVMMNVLEHIEDDGAALKTLREALNPGGRIVLYVPAFMLLYSDFDREIGHYRRYRKKQLRELVQRAGFEVVDQRYVNSLGALGWFVYSRVLGRKPSDQLTISACDRIVVPIVRRVEGRIPPPFGLSVLVVGRVA
jgi:2-polyprenyl-3-methyl-5-hydroxy-6-metoxy-1,4-benzoquinol methylase